MPAHRILVALGVLWLVASGACAGGRADSAPTETPQTPAATATPTVAASTPTRAVATATPTPPSMATADTPPSATATATPTETPAPTMVPPTPTLQPPATPTPSAPSAVAVLLDDSGLLPRFSPRQVVVAAGGTVTWQWSGALPHDVTGPGFASGIKTEGSFSHTFTTPGTFEYVCEVHERQNMRGTVVVR